MWDSTNNQACKACDCSRAKKMAHFDDLQEDSHLDKENIRTFSLAKSDELSMYENTSSLMYTKNSTSCCSHGIQSIEEHDSNSQDSGYGTSYGENVKFLSYTSPTPNSFGSNSMCSMEDEYYDFSVDLEPLEKPNDLPYDFNKLINEPLTHKTKCNNIPTIEKDTIIRPLFRRALSWHYTNAKVTPVSRRVRTNLFKTGNSDIRISKRSEPPSAPETNISVKRSRIFDEDEEEAAVPEVMHSTLQRAFSATEESIMCALQRSSTEPDLIGDFSKHFCLPLTRSRHQDLKAITPATLAQLIRGQFRDVIGSFKVIDCRYPYEFDGGHIFGALNIYTKEQCMELLDSRHEPNPNSRKRHILIFHCEFSSERGPNLYRYLRKEDRQKNETLYPNLFYPEMYLLEGGYKHFFEQFSEMCVPVAYKEMLHPDHENDFRHFRQKSRTWNCDSRHRSHSSKNFRRLGLN